MDEVPINPAPIKKKSYVGWIFVGVVAVILLIIFLSAGGEEQITEKKVLEQPTPPEASTTASDASPANIVYPLKFGLDNQGFINSFPENLPTNEPVYMINVAKRDHVLTFRKWEITSTSKRIVAKEIIRFKPGDYFLAHIAEGGYYTLEGFKTPHLREEFTVASAGGTGGPAGGAGNQ